MEDSHELRTEVRMHIYIVVPLFQEPEFIPSPMSRQFVIPSFAISWTIWNICCILSHANAVIQSIQNDWKSWSFSPIHIHRTAVLRNDLKKSIQILFQLSTLGRILCRWWDTMEQSIVSKAVDREPNESNQSYMLTVLQLINCFEIILLLLFWEFLRSA